MNETRQSYPPTPMGTRFVRGPLKSGAEQRRCTTCGKSHAAYALFSPACQKPGDGCTYFVDGKPA